jgi:hypothetical protein
MPMTFDTPRERQLYLAAANLAARVVALEHPERKPEEPVQGSPELAREVAAVLAEAGVDELAQVNAAFTVEALQSTDNINERTQR